MRLTVALSLILKCVGAALAMAFNWGVARLYGPLGSGLYGITQTSIVLLGTAAMGGLDYVVLRGVATNLKADEPGQARSLVKTIFSAGMAVALVVSFLILILHNPAARWLGNASMGPMLAVAAPAAFGLAGMRLSSFALRGAGNVLLSQAMEGAITSLLTVLMLVIVWRLPNLPPVWSIGVIYSISLLGAASIGFAAYARLSKSWPKGGRVPLWPLYAMGLPTLGTVVTNQSTEWISLTTTSMFYSTEAAGKLRVALQIMVVCNLILASFEGIIGPQVAAAWSVGDRAGISRISRQAILGTVGLTMPLFLVVAFAPNWILGLFSHDFSSAATALRIIAFGYFIALLGGPSGMILLMCGGERGSLAYSLASTVLMLGLCVWLVPKYGVNGGAITFAIVMIFRRIMSGLLVRFGLKIKIFA